MTYLIDTHYLIWSLIDPDKIEPSVQKILLDPSAVKLVSQISFWEITLKYSLGKLELNNITPEILLKTALEAGYQQLKITSEDLVSSHRLPMHIKHKDPFDRMLIWQCIRHGLTFLTVDKRVVDYVQYGLKL